MAAGLLAGGLSPTDGAAEKQAGESKEECKQEGPTKRGWQMPFDINCYRGCGFVLEYQPINGGPLAFPVRAIRPLVGNIVGLPIDVVDTYLRFVDIIASDWTPRVIAAVQLRHWRPDCEEFRRLESEAALLLGSIPWIPQFYDQNPVGRMQRLINQSEDLRQIEEEWCRIWFSDQLPVLTSQKTEPPASFTITCPYLQKFMPAGTVSGYTAASTPVPDAETPSRPKSPGGPAKQADGENTALESRLKLHWALVVDFGLTAGSVIDLQVMAFATPLWRDSLTFSFPLRIVPENTITRSVDALYQACRAVCPPALNPFVIGNATLWCEGCNFEANDFEPWADFGGLPVAFAVLCYPELWATKPYASVGSPPSTGVPPSGEVACPYLRSLAKEEKDAPIDPTTLEEDTLKQITRLLEARDVREKNEASDPAAAVDMEEEQALIPRLPPIDPKIVDALEKVLADCPDPVPAKLVVLEVVPASSEAQEAPTASWPTGTPQVEIPTLLEEWEDPDLTVQTEDEEENSGGARPPISDLNQMLRDVIDALRQGACADVDTEGEEGLRAQVETQIGGVVVKLVYDESGIHCAVVRLLPEACPDLRARQRAQNDAIIEWINLLSGSGDYMAPPTTEEELWRDLWEEPEQDPDVEI
jgi:hypothetical protein